MVRKQHGVYDNPPLPQYVNDIGQRLAKASYRPNLEYHFLVVDSPKVNAFAPPGGYVYITRGILAYLNSETGPGCRQEQPLLPRRARAGG